jgi:hypothetical protein
MRGACIRDGAGGPIQYLFRLKKTPNLQIGSDGAMWDGMEGC